MLSTKESVKAAKDYLLRKDFNGLWSVSLSMHPDDEEYIDDQQKFRALLRRFNWSIKKPEYRRKKEGKIV